MGYGIGYGMGCGVGWGYLSGTISFAILLWFVVFTVFVLNKLDKIIELLGKK